MKLLADRLTLVQSSLYGFIGKAIIPEGINTFPILMGITPRWITLMVDFLTLKASSTYNTILVRPLFRMFQVVVSTYHLIVKFPTNHRVYELKGDQSAARECYFNIPKDYGKSQQAFKVIMSKAQS